MSTQSSTVLAHIQPDKVCNNCAKIQLKNSGPFQVCSACKTATYCSQQCQKAHWKKHKLMCKSNAEAVQKLAQEPDGERMLRVVSDLRHWEHHHHSLLRTMIISALELKKNPSNITTKAGWVRISEQINSTSLPQENRFNIVGGWTTTFEEAVNEMPLKDSYMAAHKVCQKDVLKAGGLGVALLVLEFEDGTIDAMQINIPSHAEIKNLPQSQEWGDLWVHYANFAIKNGYSLTNDA